VYADTIVSQQDIDTAMKNPENTVFVKHVENPEKYGIYKADENNFALEVVEKPKAYIGNLANMGFFKMHPDILSYTEQIPLSPREEYELTDAVNMFLKKHTLKLVELENPLIDITSVEDLKRENRLFFEKLKLGTTKYIENI